MDSTLRNPSKISSFFSRIFPYGIADKIFYDNLPTKIDDSWKKIILVDSSQTWEKDAYAYGFVNIFLYAKPFANGEVNIPVLSEMETAFDTAIKSAFCDHYAIRIGEIHSDYDTSRNLHCRVYSIEITIA